MKRIRIVNVTIAITFMLSLLMITPAPVAAISRHAASAEAPFVPGQVVVGFADGQPPAAYAAQASALAGSVGAQVIKTGGSTALLGYDVSADVPALAAQLSGVNGVKFAEPNYIYTIPEDPGVIKGPAVMPDSILRKVPQNAKGKLNGKDYMAIPVSKLQSMMTPQGKTIKATYPNDPYLWWGGWSAVNADILTGNTTASSIVCVIDTGVDYNHPDLAGKITKGYDFVNGDGDPMDDMGHGTHVAGIIAAIANNAKGIAGVSTNGVVAVKGLNAQGSGTNFDIAQAIYYCANLSNTSVKVISMSLGGAGQSTNIYNAIDYAVNTNPVIARRKLVVAAAGNNASSTPSYPGGYSDTSLFPEFTNKVLSVAASGQIYSYVSGGVTYQSVDYWCQADYSNYGPWISVVAPGTWIESTLPWDRPFYGNYYYGWDTRYGSLSGTSMATPYVAAAAARRWGYKPLSTNAMVGADVINSGDLVDTGVYGGTACFDSSMSAARYLNVAALLDRGAMFGSAWDAVTGLPLDGATFQAYKTTGSSTALVGSAVVKPYTSKASPLELDPTRIYTNFASGTDIVNLPAGFGYTAKVLKPGYAPAPQAAFLYGYTAIFPGYWTSVGEAAIPPQTADISFVMQWEPFYRSDFAVHSPNPSQPWDLDLNVWLPNYPNGFLGGQPAPFIVGIEGKTFGFLESDPTGTMNAFPFANLRREGGWTDWNPIETIVVKNRPAARSPLPANAAAPYYPGQYVAMITDWGQTIDQDGDGCGDYYGTMAPPAPCAPGTTPGIPLLGSYFIPNLSVWKDGVLKNRINITQSNGGDPWGANTAGNQHWWKATAITSSNLGTAASVVISNPDQFGDVGPGGIQPYAAQGFTGKMQVLKLR